MQKGAYAELEVALEV